MTSSINIQHGASTPNPFDRLQAVLDARGIKKSQHYLDIKAGLYTEPVKIGQRACGWPRSEVAALNAARIAGKSPDAIRALVVKLMDARAAMD